MKNSRERDTTDRLGIAWTCVAVITMQVMVAMVTGREGIVQVNGTILAIATVVWMIDLIAQMRATASRYHARVTTKRRHHR